MHIKWKSWSDSVRPFIEMFICFSFFHISFPLRVVCFLPISSHHKLTAFPLSLNFNPLFVEQFSCWLEHWLSYFMKCFVLLALEVKLINLMDLRGHSTQPSPKSSISKHSLQCTIYKLVTTQAHYVGRSWLAEWVRPADYSIFSLSSFLFPLFVFSSINLNFATCYGTKYLYYWRPTGSGS